MRKAFGFQLSALSLLRNWQPRGLVFTDICQGYARAKFRVDRFDENIGEVSIAATIGMNSIF